MDEEFLNLLNEKNADKIKRFIEEFSKRHIDFDAAEDTIFGSASQKKRINIERKRLEHFLNDNMDLLFKYGSYMEVIDYQASMLNFDSSVADDIKKELALLDVSVGLSPLLMSTLPSLLYAYERKLNEEEGSNLLWR